MIDRTLAALDQLYQRSRYREDDDLVFGHPELGPVLDASKLRKRFKHALAEAGVREIRFHDLRHTFGTQAAAAGVPLRTLQEWAGPPRLQDHAHLRRLRTKVARATDDGAGVLTGRRCRCSRRVVAANFLTGGPVAWPDRHRRQPARLASDAAVADSRGSLDDLRVKTWSVSLQAHSAVRIADDHNIEILASPESTVAVAAIRVRKLRMRRPDGTGYAAALVAEAAGEADDGTTAVDLLANLAAPYFALAALAANAAVDDPQDLIAFTPPLTTSPASSRCNGGRTRALPHRESAICRRPRSSSSSGAWTATQGAAASIERSRITTWRWAI